jgi:hypothetical protein
MSLTGYVSTTAGGTATWLLDELPLSSAHMDALTPTQFQIQGSNTLRKSFMNMALAKNSLTGDSQYTFVLAFTYTTTQGSAGTVSTSAHVSTNAPPATRKLCSVAFSRCSSQRFVYDEGQVLE